MSAAEINKAATDHHLLHAASKQRRCFFIGGNVAENAGGNKVIKYGATGSHVLGMEVVLPDGSVTWFGGKRSKDVTGYDFVHLMVGSKERRYSNKNYFGDFFPLICSGSSCSIS